MRRALDSRVCVYPCPLPPSPPPLCLRERRQLLRPPHWDGSRRVLIVRAGCWCSCCACAPAAKTYAESLGEAGKTANNEIFCAGPARGLGQRRGDRVRKCCSWRGEYRGCRTATWAVVCLRGWLGWEAYGLCCAASWVLLNGAPASIVRCF